LRGIKAKHLFLKIIVLFAIPNGLLKSTYGNCVNSGKHARKLNRLHSRGDIRFLYKDAKNFENLKDKPLRIKIIYPEKPTEELIKNYLGLKKLDPGAIPPESNILVPGASLTVVLRYFLPAATEAKL